MAAKRLFEFRRNMISASSSSFELVIKGYNKNRTEESGREGERREDYQLASSATLMASLEMSYASRASKRRENTPTQCSKYRNNFRCSLYK